MAMLRPSFELLCRSVDCATRVATPAACGPMRGGADAQDIGEQEVFRARSAAPAVRNRGVKDAQCRAADARDRAGRPNACSTKHQAACTSLLARS
nr:hypothetical protein [Burkholderia ambifaria]